MDYYSTLGLQRGASDADIKKAYRSLAMKHHPDRGGDEKKFKDINQAYAYLTDPQKKQIIDMGGDPNQQSQGFRNQSGPFEFHFGSGNFEDIFSQFGFNRAQTRNKSFSISIEITLEDVVSGKSITAEVGIAGGKKKIINIEIPPGIEHGQQIKYQGMGDHSIIGVKPGDLFVNIIVRPHPTFQRHGNNLFVEKTISVWDAILGTSIEIVTIDRKTLNITVPPSTQTDTVLNCKGEGVPNMNTGVRGNMLIKIKVSIPENLNEQQIEKVKQLRSIS